MPRFFVENFKDLPQITGEDAAHIAKSLRMRPGEHLTVCDTEMTEYDCEIDRITGDTVYLRILQAHSSRTEPALQVTLYMCLPKADKADQIVRQAVELGVSRIVPVVSARCVSRPEDKAMAKKLARWQKIAAEAAGQSGRGKIPQVAQCIPFAQCAEQMADFDLGLFFWELGGSPLAGLPLQGVKTLALVTGPEGGFGAEEAAQMQQAGAVTATLGPRILRAETAPIAALAAVMLLAGELQ